MDNAITATWENGAPRIGDSLVSGESLFVGTPGMASLSVALAAGMNIQLDCEVAGIACTAAGSWQLRRRDGRELGTFDWLVSSAPAPLTAELLAPVAPVLAQEAARCHYAPCWSVMARCENWNASGPALIRPTGSPLAWVIANRLLRFSHRIVLILKNIRPHPTTNGCLVGLQYITAQIKAGVQKNLVVLISGVEILHQSQQAISVKMRQFGFHISPGWVSFLGSHYSVSSFLHNGLFHDDIYQLLLQLIGIGDSGLSFLILFLSINFAFSM